MKKYLAILPLVAFVFTANPAFAKENRNGINIKNDIKLKMAGRNHEAHVDKEEKFRSIRATIVLNGTVKSKTSDTITLSIKNWGNSRYEWEMFNADKQWFKENLKLDSENFTGEITIKINNDTKITKNQVSIKLDQLAVGDNIVVVGKRDGTDFVASHVRITFPKGKISGEVTTKTDTSVTVKNNVTGESKTVVVNPDTEVKINGEAKSTAEIQVGDKGFIKYKVIVDSVVAKAIKLFR